MLWLILPEFIRKTQFSVKPLDRRKPSNKPLNRKRKKLEFYQELYELKLMVTYPWNLLRFLFKNKITCFETFISRSLNFYALSKWWVKKNGKLLNVDFEGIATLKLYDIYCKLYRLYSRLLNYMVFQIYLRKNASNIRFHLSWRYVSRMSIIFTKKHTLKKLYIS